MKRFSLLVIIIVLVGSVLPKLTYAQSCESATKVVADIWEEAGDVALKIGCGVAGGAGAAVGVEVDFDACYESAQKYANLTEKMIDFWNNAVGHNWAVIGPRQLSMNTDLKGTLWGTSGRMFVTAYPMASDKVTITIDERDGKAKTSVVVCKFDQNSKHTKLATKWFNDTSDRRNKSDEHRKVEVTGARGYILSVHFDAKEILPTKKFAYTLRAEEDEPIVAEVEDKGPIKARTVTGKTVPVKKTTKKN